jgi:hypothetical protein
MNPDLRQLTLAAVLLIALPAAAQSPPPAGPPGERIKLTDGQLFIPEGFRPEADSVPLTLHLHGAYWAAEKNQVLSKQPGVLVTVVLPGLSAVYHERFKDPQTFRRILDEATARLREKLGHPQLEIGEVAVTSFSAGFGGVRQMLQDPPTFDRVSTLVMADSLYAGFIGDPTKREVDPTNMEAFVRFAREAVAGKRRFVVTHTQLFTPTYASTVDTADYLLKALGGERKPVERDWGGGLTEIGEWGKGKFLLYSFKGETGPEHMLHLHNLWQFLLKAQ